MQRERPIDADEEARLDALVRRLQSGGRSGDADDALIDLVAALRTHDRVSDEARERHVDAFYEAHADTARRRTLVDHFATRFERSTLFKVLAASVLAHVLALPVVALVLLAPEPKRSTPDISFEPIDRSPVPIGEESRDELDLSDAFNAALLADRERLVGFRAQLIERARVASLERVSDARADERLVERVLRTRLALLAGRAGDERIAADLAAWRADAAIDLAGDAALLELALDAYALRSSLRAAAAEVALALVPRVGGAGATRARAYGITAALGVAHDAPYVAVDPAAFVRALEAHTDVDDDLVAAFARLGAE